MEYATLEWVDGFNNRRLLEPIGSIPPAEAEAKFYAAIETEELATSLRQISRRKTRRGSLTREGKTEAAGEGGLGDAHLEAPLPCDDRPVGDKPDWRCSGPGRGLFGHAQGC